MRHHSSLSADDRLSLVRTSARLLGLVPADASSRDALRVVERHFRTQRSSERGASLEARLLNEIRKTDLQTVFELERQVAPIASRIQAAGVPFDPAGWSALLRCRRDAADGARLVLTKQFGLARPDDGKACASVGRRLDIPLTDARRAELMLHRGHPFVDALMTYRTESAFAYDLGPKLLQAGRNTGRIHCNLDPLGTDTGRFTASSPNMLGLERRKDVRACIRAPEGRVLVWADYAQMDLRVLAVVANDPRLCACFREACDDLHKRITAAFLDIDETDVTDAQRNAGKAVGFAIAYGAGELGVQDYAATSLGVPLTKEEAASWRRGYLEHFNGVADWQAQRNMESGECRSLLGRRRVVADNDLPAKLNGPIAMTSADVFKLALIETEGALEGLDAQVVLPVHDEIVVEADARVADEVAARLQFAMELAMRDVLGDAVPAVVEVKIGETWSG
jgi:DNA polymerase I